MSKAVEKYKYFRNSFRRAVEDSFGNTIGGIDLSIRSDRSVYVDGCIGIDEFCKERVVFLGKGMNVTVNGCGIELYTFENGCIRASGEISCVEITRWEGND